MARKRLSLFTYQHVLEEMRAGTSARAIAEKKLASRNTVRQIREKAIRLGWLDLERPLPTPEELKSAFPAPQMPIQKSKVERYAREVSAWAEAGHTPQQIFRRLRREDPSFDASVG